MGKFVNPGGYALTKLPRPARPWYHPVWWNPPAYYHVSMDIDHPLTWVDRYEARTGSQFTSDKGSVPAVFEWVIRDDAFLLSFLYHDSAYHSGGWYVHQANGFRFVELTRRQADDILYDMVISEGGSVQQARLIWAAVRMGGARGWKGAKCQS